MTNADMELMLTPWRNLANAIIEQAAKDYMRTLRKLKKQPTSERAKLEKASIEKFFRSPWYEELTDVDGERLIRMLQKEIKRK